MSNKLTLIAALTAISEPRQIFSDVPAGRRAGMQIGGKGKAARKRSKERRKIQKASRKNT